ncbi:MAG TPA: GNAT family N-acetyltransferase [Steroidobacteraceae bacterium]|nr:GNAT family N-acetyltransferase [Steroidobacteraceae bacterium]
MLRQAVAADIPGIQRVRASVRENRLVSTVISDEDVRDAIERDGRGWVVELQHEIVAFAIGNAKSGNIWALFVHPDHERRGHGRRLHDAMLDWLWAQGLGRLWLTTEPDSRAQGFYEAAGWSLTGRTASGELQFEMTRGLQIRPVRSDADIASIGVLFREYAAAIGIDLEYQGFSAELASLPGKYAPPTGELFIATDAGVAAGCVALRALTRTVTEMKRLYVRPSARGTGLGKRLVESAIASARRGGYEELRLDTLATMAPAQALYRSLGFVEIPAYGDAHVPGTVFYGLNLVD